MKQSAEARRINLKTSKPYSRRKPNDHNERHIVQQKLLRVRRRQRPYRASTEYINVFIGGTVLFTRVEKHQ